MSGMTGGTAGGTATVTATGIAAQTGTGTLGESSGIGRPGDNVVSKHYRVHQPRAQQVCKQIRMFSAVSLSTIPIKLRLAAHNVHSNCCTTLCCQCTANYCGRLSFPEATLTVSEMNAAANTAQAVRAMPSNKNPCIMANSM